MSDLRGMGYAAERDTLSRSLKAQMKYADKLSARASVVIGEDEVASGKIVVKNMQNGEKTECALAASAISAVLSNMEE